MLGEWSRGPKGDGGGGILRPMRGMPTGWWRGGLAAGVAALAVLAQLPTLDRSAVPVDEGQLVSIADRILHGEVLYRDVYTGIFPGIYYVTALLLDVFGEDVLVTRWAQALVNAATVACLGLLGLRVMRPAWAGLAPVLYLALVIVGFPGLTMFNYSPQAPSSRPTATPSTGRADSR